MRNILLDRNKKISRRIPLIIAILRELIKNETNIASYM